MKIGIIGAMDVEIKSLLSRLREERTVTRARMVFHEGFIGQTPVVIVKSGIGKVNAGMCVQILADLFGVSHVINTGVAGSLDNRIDIGDIVVSEQAMYYDVDATVFGYAPGEVPQLGMARFDADPALRALAVKAVAEAAPEVKAFEGLVISGDQFIAGSEKKQRLIEDFGGLCTEMEGAAIAHAATLNGLPFVIIRAISDKADESVQVSYNEFEEKAAIHCAGITGYLLSRLGEAAD